MSRPRKVHSIDDSTSTGAGEAIDLAGRTVVAVQVESDDPTGLELEVQVKIDEDAGFAPVFRPNTGTQILTLEANDLASGEQQTRDTAYVVGHHIVGSQVRAVITSAPAGSTDVWLAVSTTTDAAQTLRDVTPDTV